jgi:hypothetical protein
MNIKKICLLLMLFPLLSNAQGKTYFSIAFGKDFPKHYHVIGGHFTANRSLGGGLYLGAGTSFLKFDNTEHFYFPVFGNISFMSLKPSKKISPVGFIQPGYGFYRLEGNDVTTRGGFTFHSSAGITYPFLFHRKGFTTVGFAHYTFKTGHVSSERNSWGLRLGMLL